jgi:hypothetical protein
MFLDDHLILSKSKGFDCNSYLQSKLIYKVLKLCQEYIKEKFNMVYSDMHPPLAI